MLTETVRKADRLCQVCQAEKRYIDTKVAALESNKPIESQTSLESGAIEMASGRSKVSLSKP